jgi:hypothetical protein
MIHRILKGSGYSGGGPDALAILLDRLLDDITSSPVARSGTPPAGLLSLIEGTAQDGTTLYTRDQLLAARRGPG